MKKREEELRSEYKRSDFGGLTRGKYAHGLRKSKTARARRASRAQSGKRS